MARKSKSKVTLDVALRTALQTHTQRGLAAKLGVSPRTVGRWLHGEAKPREPARVQRKITPIYYGIKRAVDAANAAYTGPAAFTPPKTAIPVEGERREIKERDAFGKPTGEMKFSDWVNFNVKYLDTDSIMDILRDIRDRAGPRGVGIQLIYRIKAGAYSPYQRTHVDKAQREATGIKQIYPDMKDAQLWRATIGPLVSSDARILFVAVLD